MLLRVKRRSDLPVSSTGEPREKKKWVEPVVALLMALATLSTAWCSFESAAWTRRTNRLMNEFNALERKAGLQMIQGTQQATIHVTMFMQLLAAQEAGDEKLVNVFPPMCARLMTPGYNRSPLKIQVPIRIPLCQSSINRAGRAKPTTRPRRLQPASRKRTLFCLPRCFSSPARRESSSSSACDQWLSSSRSPFSPLL